METSSANVRVSNSFFPLFSCVILPSFLTSMLRVIIPSQTSVNHSTCTRSFHYRYRYDIPCQLSVKTIYTKPPVTPVKRSYTDSSLDETINPHPNPNFYQAGYESLFFKEIGRKIRGTRLCTRKPPRYGAHQIDTNKNPSPFTQNKRRGGMRNAQCNAMHT